MGNNYHEYCYFSKSDGKLQKVSRKDWKTKSTWKRWFRKVLPNAQPQLDYQTGLRLYSLNDTATITPTARQLAYRDFETIYRFHSCDPEKWICARPADDGEQRWTEYATSGWHGTHLQRFWGNWSLARHLSGKKMLGICAADETQVAFFDLDNHENEHDPHWHLERVMTLATDLATRYPNMKLAAEVNPLNGSTKLQVLFRQGYQVETEINPWLAEFQKNLHARFPHLRYDQMEIFPLNRAQMLIPLRPDKITIIDGLLEKIPHYSLNSDRRRVPIEIYSVEDFIKYLRGDGRNLDLAVLRSQVIQSLYWNRLAATRSRRQAKKQNQSNCGAVRYKNNFLSHIADFVEGSIAPDTIGRYTTPLERYLMVAEGLSRYETWELIHTAIARHSDVSYSTRLSHEPKEFWRSDAYTRKAIAKGNGYQGNPRLSDEKLLAVKARWDAQKIDVVQYLKTGDKSHIRRERAMPRMKVAWTPEAIEQAAELAVLANCSLDKSREILEVVGGHVRHGGEMAIEYLRGMLVRLGLKCRHHNKAVKIRQWLERTGWIVKVRNYWYKDGRGMGNYYGLGLLVQEQDEEVAVPVSILLSIPSRPEQPTWFGNLLTEQRRFTLEEGYRRRWRQMACA